MNTILIWTLALIALGLFIYFVPYRNIKLVQKKLDTIIDLLNKKEIIVLNKVDLLEKKKVNEIIKSFSKNKNCEVLVLSTLEKSSISKVKAELLKYVS